MGKYFFEILRNQRSKQSITAQNSQIQLIQKYKIQRRKLGQTKNIIANYRSVFKKILNDKIVKGVTVQMQKQILNLIHEMQKHTNIKTIKTLIIQNIWFQTYMIKMGDNGQFQKYIIQSNMKLPNKLVCIKYLNCILNAFRNPQKFTQWVQFIKPQQSIYKRKISKIQSDTLIRMQGKKTEQNKINFCTEQSEIKINQYEYWNQFQECESPLFKNDFQNNYQNIRLNQIYRDLNDQDISFLQ